jgi:hypothetical protein
MNDEIFSRLVADDVKNRVSDAQREYLELPQNRERWKRALVALVRNLSAQIDDIKSDKELDIDRYSQFGEDGKALLAEAMTSYDSRLAKIERFKFYVDKRLDYVVSLGEDESVAARAQFLEAAIRKHKELMIEFDMEETDLDVALWEALDNKWSFDDIKSQ